MKRYSWEYNGEKMGLFERKDGICVLWSDVQPLLNQDIIALRSELEQAEARINDLEGVMEKLIDAAHQVMGQEFGSGSMLMMLPRLTEAAHEALDAIKKGE